MRKLMILAPSTLETIHEITGEEPMPRSTILRRIVSLIYAVDPTIWSRPADICLIGGDPITLARRLTALAKARDYRSTSRIAVIHSGDFSGAPLAALCDDDVLDGFVSDGALAESQAYRHLSGEDRVRRIVDAVVDEALGQLRLGASSIILAVDHVQGARDHARDEIVLRLTRDREAARRGPGQARPAGGGAQRLVSAGPAAEDLFERSERLAHAGIARLRRGLGAFATQPPAGARFADVLVARRVEVLSGFISPGVNPKAIRFDESFMEREIGADLFRFSRGVPTSVEDAISFWRADLVRARGVSRDNVIT